jgi:hypothetical protein
MQFNTLLTLAPLAFGYFFQGVAAGNSGYARSCNSIIILAPAPPNANWWSINANCAYENGTFSVGGNINIGSCLPMQMESL